MSFFQKDLAAKEGRAKTGLEHKFKTFRPGIRGLQPLPLHTPLAPATVVSALLPGVPCPLRPPRLCSHRCLCLKTLAVHPLCHLFPEPPWFIRSGNSRISIRDLQGSTVLGWGRGRKRWYQETCLEAVIAQLVHYIYLAYLSAVALWDCGNHNASPSPAGMKFCFSWVLSAQGLSWSCGKAGIWASHAPASSPSLPSALHFGLGFCQPGGMTSS